MAVRLALATAAASVMVALVVVAYLAAAVDVANSVVHPTSYTGGGR